MTRERPLVLVVDDDAQARNLVRTTLLGAGYEVETAQDGETALASVRDKTPDLILLDMVLPGLNGWGVLRRLPPKPPPVVVISGEYLPAAALGLTSSLVRAYLVKPFSMRSLLTTCQGVLDPSSSTERPLGERRQEPRVPIAVSATLVGADRRPLAVGQTVDVTGRGVRLRLGMDLALGQKVRLTLDLPGEAAPLYLLGTARWSRGGHAGIEISDLSAAAGLKLKQLISRPTPP